MEMDIGNRLKELIYKNKISEVVNLLEKTKDYIEPDDYLTYCITHKHNEMAKILINSHKIDIEYNDNIALSISQKNNLEIYRFLKNIYNSPLKEICVKIPFIDSKIFKIYGHTTLYHLKQFINKYTKREYSIYIDNVLFYKNILLYNVCRYSDSIDVKIKINIETYPSSNGIPTRMVNIMDELSDDEIKYIYNKKDKYVNLDGFIKKSVVRGKDISWIDLERKDIMEIIELAFIKKDVSITYIIKKCRLPFENILSIFLMCTQHTFDFNFDIDKTSIFEEICEYIENNEKYLQILKIECENKINIFNSEELEILYKYNILKRSSIIHNNKDIIDEWHKYSTKSQAQLMLWSSRSIPSIKSD